MDGLSFTIYRKTSILMVNLYVESRNFITQIFQKIFPMRNSKQDYEQLNFKIKKILDNIDKDEDVTPKETVILNNLLCAAKVIIDDIINIKSPNKKQRINKFGDVK